MTKGVSNLEMEKYLKNLTLKRLAGDGKGGRGFSI